MAVSFHARDNGYVHVCGHRGYSSHYPENTLVAFEAARLAGATTCEIDVMLTRDDEIVVMHDPIVDRTTNGHGMLADMCLVEARALDAGSWFNPRFAGACIPTLAEVVLWAKQHDIGIVIEMKERERPDALTDRMLGLLRALDGFGHVSALSFNHVDLARLKQKEPGVRIEAIFHARHVDMVQAARACGADSASIEFGMLHSDDLAALHEAGISNRVSLPSITAMGRCWAHGRDPRATLGAALREGLIDSVSCDDVAFARTLVEQNPIAG